MSRGLFNLLRTGVPAAAKATVRAPVKAYKAYNKAFTPLADHAAARVPERFRPMARGFTGGAKLTLTAGFANEGRRSFENSVGGSARQLAQTAGIQDPERLQAIEQRARERAFPLAWQSVAPTWLGGDATPAGQELARDVRTIAQHNVLPLMFQPSAQTVAERSPAHSAFMSAAYSPVTGLAPYVLPQRPSATQMWQNIPQATRQNLASRTFQAAAQPTNLSPIARELQYIAAPAFSMPGAQ